MQNGLAARRLRVAKRSRIFSSCGASTVSPFFTQCSVWHTSRECPWEKQKKRSTVVARGATCDRSMTGCTPNQRRSPTETDPRTGRASLAEQSSGTNHAARARSRGRRRADLLMRKLSIKRLERDEELREFLYHVKGIAEASGN